MGLLYTDSVRLYNLIYFCCQMIYGQNVGIGTTSPTAALHVNGSFKLTNGSEGAGKVLTSDAYRQGQLGCNSLFCPNRR